jgi:hypothetical protein
MKKDYKKLGEKILADKRIGKVPDDELGEEYGVSKTFVCKLRAKHGIEFQWKRTPGPGRTAPSREKLQKHLYLLGKFSDCSIAHMLEVNKESVRRLRISLNIPVAPPGKTLQYKPLSDETKLLEGWRCIPERVGLTRNQWRKRCASI